MDDTQHTGWCITLFGSTLVQMALVWYATMQTSSGVWVAAFTVCSYLPQFLISFVGGVWADRYHRKKLIIGADMLIAFATFIMVLAIPHISSEPTLLGGLLVMSVIRSLGAGIHGANGNYHYAARKNRHIYARACLWITRNNVLRLFADWYGYIWSISGYSSLAVDYDWIGYCAYYNFGYHLF